jgi:hypothetical protein
LSAEINARRNLFSLTIKLAFFALMKPVRPILGGSSGFDNRHF